MIVGIGFNMLANQSALFCCVWYMLDALRGSPRQVQHCRLQRIHRLHAVGFNSTMRSAERIVQMHRDGTCTAPHEIDCLGWFSMDYSSPVRSHGDQRGLATGFPFVDIGSELSLLSSVAFVDRERTSRADEGKHEAACDSPAQESKGQNGWELS